MSDREAHYITRDGAKKLQEELARLRSAVRPAIVQEVADAAAQGDRSENAEYIYGKKKLREIDRRIHWLTRRLESVTVVEPRAAETDVVYFGAYVGVEDEHGARATYRLVGEDEIDLDRGHVSWRSPLGRAVLRRREGDTVILQRPSGPVEVTLVRVQYEAPAGAPAPEGRGAEVSAAGAAAGSSAAGAAAGSSVDRSCRS